MSRLRIGVSLCALALASNVLALPKDPHQRDPREAPEHTCVRTWVASTCADETYADPATPLIETVRATADANQVRHTFFFGGRGEPPFDVNLNANLSAGDGAAGIIVDIELFLSNLRKDKPTVANDLNTALLACVLIGLNAISGDCPSLINNVLSNVDIETYKASALWWQGCFRSNSLVSKTFPAVPGKQ